jgi:hypothetical protein
MSDSKQKSAKKKEEDKLKEAEPADKESPAADANGGVTKGDATADAPAKEVSVAAEAVKDAKKEEQDVVKEDGGAKRDEKVLKSDEALKLQEVAISALNISTVPTLPTVDLNQMADPEPRLAMSKVMTPIMELPGVRFSTKFVSAFGAPDILTKDHKTILRQWNGPKIGNFTDDYSFTLAEMKLHRELIDFYVGIHRGIKDTENEYNRACRVTDQSQIGAPFLTLLGKESLLSQDQEAAVAVYNTFGSDRVRGGGLEGMRKSKLLDSLVSPEEVEFTRELNALERRKILMPGDPERGIERMRAFFRTMETTTHYLKPLEPDLDLVFRFTEWPLSEGDQAFDYLLTHNRTIRHAVIEMARQVVDNETSTPFEDTLLEFNELITRLGVRTGTHARKNRIAAMLSEANARKMARSMDLIGMMSEGIRFSLPRKWDEFALETLFDCICAKLTPAHYWTLSQRNFIDNYIARHLMRFTKGYRPRVQMDHLAAQEGSVNYLTQQFDTGAIDAATAAALKPFFYTDGTNGWLEAGDQSHVSMATIPDASLFLNRRAGDVLYTHISGPNFEEGDEVEQHRRFREVYTFFSARRDNLTFGRPSRQDEDSIVALMEVLDQSGTQIRDMVYQFGKRTRALSFLSINRPMPIADALLTDGRTIEQIEVPALGLLSMFRLTKWEEFQDTFLGDKFVIRVRISAIG